MHVTRRAFLLLLGCGLGSTEADAQAVVFAQDDPGPEASFGPCIAALGDLDDDGLDDFAVEVFDARGTRSDGGGHAELRSGADGHVLARVPEGDKSLRIIGALAAVGDVDGDGSCDVALASP